MDRFDIAVIGAGGAGLTAAIYAARARRSTVVFEGLVTGGQIATTDLVENYPGFPDGVNGFDLADAMRRQAEKFGAELRYEPASAITLSDDGAFTVATSEETIAARALVVTAGAAYNRLGVAGEEALTGKGVSYCATCDAPFFAGKEAIVVGGGDTAFDEGLFLARYASRVHLVHRRDSFRASPLLQERVRANGRFRFVLDTVVDEILGTGEVEGARLRNLKTGDVSTLPVSAVFIFAGQTPNSALLKGVVPLDAGGHALVDLEMRTSVPGLFVAGDLRTKAARQLISACGDGATAAIAADHYLAEQAAPAAPAAVRR